MRNFPPRWLLVLLAASAPGLSLAESAVLVPPAQVWTAAEPLHPGWVLLTQGALIVAVGPQSSEVRASVRRNQDCA